MFHVILEFLLKMLGVPYNVAYHCKDCILPIDQQYKEHFHLHLLMNYGSFKKGFLRPETYVGEFFKDNKFEKCQYQRCI